MSQVAVETPKGSKTIEKKSVEVKKATRRSKARQHNPDNRNLINLNVDVGILDILTKYGTKEDKKTKEERNEAFKQLALQLGLNSQAIHGRKGILADLSTTDKQRIFDAQKVILVGRRHLVCSHRENQKREESAYVH